MVDLRSFAVQSGIISDSWATLPSEAQRLPEFPVDVLPEMMSAHCRAVAESVQTPLDMVVCFALGVASSALVGRVEVQPKHIEKDYTEAIQLYLLCRAESGERKTPALNRLKKPLVDCLDRRRKDVQEQNADLKREVNAYRNDMRRAKDHAEQVRIEKSLDDCEAKLTPEPEFLQGDFSAEAICNSMNSHGGKAIVLCDEGDFLNVLTGRSYQREGGSVNLQAVLSGYTNSNLDGERIQRGEWHIPRASLAMCMGVQPKLLEEFMKDLKGADRGLHARFLYFSPESMIGKRAVSMKPVPDKLDRWWRGMIETLETTARKEPLIIEFDHEAEEAYISFCGQIEKRLCGDLDGMMRAWASKLCGNTVRVAGILSMLDSSDYVERKHWDAAETITETYLIPHAKRLFCGADANLSSNAQLLLEKLKDEEGSFREADFWSKRMRYVFKGTGEGGRTGRDMYGDALNELNVHGYIRKSADQDEYFGSGRKPSTRWDVNPGIRQREYARPAEVLNI